MNTGELSALLDHGAVDRSVSADRIEQQLKTAVCLEQRLKRFGGAILGDEVGTGKTFVSFALLAEALTRDPARGAVILVPTELLERKWERQLRSYLATAVRDRSAGERLAERIVRVDRSLRVVGTESRPKRNAIIIGRHSLFAYQVSRADRAVVLDAYLDSRRDLLRRPRKRLLEACGLSTSDANPSRARWADPELLARHPRALQPLDEPFERWRSGDRSTGWAFSNAIQEVRRRVGNLLLPSSSLLVIDEAHNLRSTGSQVYRSLMEALQAKFDALLFLTATPFQLGRHELLNIVEFFRNARGHAEVRAEFDQAVQRMGASMDEYVHALDAFGRGWSGLTTEEARRAVQLAKGDVPDAASDKVPAQVADLFAACLAAKKSLEGGLEPFLVRSVRERHHDERTGLGSGTEIEPTSRIPLALVDRMLYELFRERGRTFVASISQGACSSWEAMLSSAAMDEERAEGSSTRRQIRALHRKDALGAHPKVDATAQFCLEGVEGGEKTLVFVERVATGVRLRDELTRRLAEADPEDDAKDALQRRTRFGWPSLRENYLQTVYPVAFGDTPDLRRLNSLAKANRSLFHRVDTGRGTERNYATEKRFWEHVYVLAMVDSRPDWATGLNSQLAETVKRLASPDYVLNGLDLVSGESGDTLKRPTTKTRAEHREPRLEFARAYIRYPSPWATHAAVLAGIPPDWRAKLVDYAAAAIARSHLRHELAGRATKGDPASHFRSIGRLLEDRSRGWPQRFEALVAQMAAAAQESETKAAEQRVSDLLGGLSGDQRVQFLGPDSKGETRDRAVAAFNTPLYPDVMVATPVLAEGIDLHRSCRRVVHHDLPWNPAKLEQRTGRVDRVGSLAEHLREQDGTTRIEVSLPYMDGTYDQFIFSRVMARRREFRCLLGSPPEWEDDELADEDRGEPIAEELVERLQVRLGA